MNLKEKNEAMQDKIRSFSSHLLSSIVSLVKNLNERKKKEWKFFQNQKCIIEYNEQCKKCNNKCKQSFRAELIICPNFNLRSCVK